MIRFRCPNCESQMEVDESFAGRPARCPTCGTDLKVPAHGAPAGGARHTPPPAPGSARITVGGESVDVVPPMEIMVIVSLACVVLAVVLFLVAGLTKFVTPPWAVGALLGALAALLGAIIGVPAYHSVRRSKGRRRGRTHALLAMAAGAGLFLVLLVVALVGFAGEWMRPTCEENLARLYKALRQYADTHRGAFPPSLETLVSDGYLESADWLTCPAYKVPAGQNTYILTPQINLQRKRDDGSPWWPPDTLIVSDGPPYSAHRDGAVRVLLLDGKINAVPVGRWPSYQKSQTERWSHIIWQMREAGIPVKPPGSGVPGPGPGEKPPAGGAPAPASGETAPATEGAS